MNVIREQSGLVDLRLMKNAKLMGFFTDHDYTNGNVSLMIHIADMSTCRSTNAFVHLNLKSTKNAFNPTIIEKTKVMAYDDGTYDVFTYSEGLCTGARCKVTFNSKGVVVDGPIAYLPSQMSIYDVEIFSPTTKFSPKNFFAVLKHFDINDVGHVYKRDEIIAHSTYKTKTHILYLMYAGVDGKATKLLEIDDERERYGWYKNSENQLLHVDDSNERLGICWFIFNTTSVKCVQYNADGNVTLETLLNLIFPIKILKIHNAPRFGFLLLVAECRTDRCEQRGDLYVRYVSPAKEDSRVMEIPVPECSHDWYDNMNIEEARYNQLCVNVICNKKKLVVKKCFSSSYVYN